MRSDRLPLISRLARLSCIAIGLVLALTPGALTAEAAFADPLAPSALEADLLTEADAGRLQRFSLIEAALVASGADQPEQLRGYRRKYEAWRDAARAVCRPESLPRQRAQAIFEFMHREILHGAYDAAATELTLTLDKGTFNCVSATVLFNALAADCGLSARAVELPRHAFSVLVAGDDPLVIETTCPNWFRESRTVPPADMRVGRTVSPLALVAVIYYNRGIELLARGEFAAAVSANLRALRFDPSSETARGNLLTAINNWGLARADAGEYREAAALLAQGRRLSPGHEPFLNNQRHVYRLWIESLAERGQRAEAAGVLSDARRTQPESPVWDDCAKRLGL